MLIIETDLYFYVYIISSENECDMKGIEGGVFGSLVRDANSHFTDSFNHSTENDYVYSFI